MEGGVSLSSVSPLQTETPSPMSPAVETYNANNPYPLRKNQQLTTLPHHQGDSSVTCGGDGKWKTDAVPTRNTSTTSWVDELRGTHQEKMVEQALNLDLGSLSHKQLVEFFVQVTDEPQCKAQK